MFFSVSRTCNLADRRANTGQKYKTYLRGWVVCQARKNRLIYISHIPSVIFTGGCEKVRTWASVVDPSRVWLSLVNATEI